MQRTHYEVLQVSRQVSPDVLKAAYRVLASKHHPDKFPEGQKAKAEQNMQVLNAAWNILSDPEKRSAYDAQIGVVNAAERATNTEWEKAAREAYRKGYEEEQERRARAREEAHRQLKKTPGYKAAAFFMWLMKWTTYLIVAIMLYRCIT